MPAGSLPQAINTFLMGLWTASELDVGVAARNTDVSSLQPTMQQRYHS